MKLWSIQAARDTYNVPYWSHGYVDINDKGNVVMRTSAQQPAPAVDLTALVKRAHEQGLQLPTLFRFPGILHDRVAILCNAFVDAMKNLNYDGGYNAVYPIKVNQQRRVVEEIINAPVKIDRAAVGLEAGSKPELMAVLALTKNPNSVIVCNGYKDREYIRLALLGEKMGRKVFIVVEKLSELSTVLQEAKAMQVTPRVGVRVRLMSTGKGNWQNSGGEKAKFGLSASQVLEAVDILKKDNALASLQMVHFHLGSQISNIQDIQRCMREAARYFGEISKLGARITCFDVGGGLGIDYEGTRSRSYYSMNYSVYEYAENVVRAIREVCEQLDLPHPDVITESGRALTAHHAVLITNVIDVERINNATPLAVNEKSPGIIRDLWAEYDSLMRADASRPLIEIYHNVVYALGEAQGLYIHGILSLAEKAQAENIYFACCEELRRRLDESNRVHRELIDELNERLADKIFLNFSLFQSIPDAWGIDQVFPVMPIHRLNEPPARRGVIQDITCDSDGRIDTYLDNGRIETSMPLPAHRENEPLLVAIFLVGAYQEILGDLHNLFGDTDSVDVYIKNETDYELLHQIKGDTVAKVLQYVNFAPSELLEQVQTHLRASNVTESELEGYLDELEAGLTGYTYLEE